MLSILIVDDSFDNLTLLNDFLRAKSHHVTECSSGQEAVKILELQKFDLIISDYQMPNGNGLWLLDEIKKMPLPPKLIIMSSDNELSEKFFQTKGAYAFLLRPVDWQKLELLIQDFNLK